MYRTLGRTVLVSNLLLTLLGTGRSPAQWVEPGHDAPAHFDKAPHPAGPPILAGKQLSGPFFTRHFQAVIYKMAALIAPVLYQQPCFCRCDLAMRHKSLHSCFEGLHGAARPCTPTSRRTRAKRRPRSAPASNAANGNR